MLARSLPQLSLPSFRRLQPAQLVDDVLIELFTARGAIDIPAEVNDIVRMPFWAAALARFGLQAESGLQLLRLIMEHRLELAFTEPLLARKTREALGVIALAAQPAVVVETRQALDVLEAWMTSGVGRDRWEREPTETMLERARESGLVEAETETITFLHPLLAATLAAEATVESPDAVETVGAHAELVSMTAALLPDERAPEMLELLVEHDIFFLARMLRLSYRRRRLANFEADLDRYRLALQRLAPLAGEPAEGRLLTGTVLGLQDTGWTAIGVAAEAPDQEPGDFEALQSACRGQELLVWQGDAFAERSPELLAAGEVPMQFKDAMNTIVAIDQPGEYLA
jgi:hypothetical protein